MNSVVIDNVVNQFSK